MSPLLIYTLFAVPTFILSVVAVYAFIRFRFKGDRTIAIITFFYIMFLGTALLTFTLLRPVSAVGTTPFQ